MIYNLRYHTEVSVRLLQVVGSQFLRRNAWFLADSLHDESARCPENDSGIIKKKKTAEFLCKHQWIGIWIGILRKIHWKVPGTPTAFALCAKNPETFFPCHGCEGCFPMPPRLSICSDSLSSDGVSGMQRDTWWRTTHCELKWGGLVHTSD